MTTLYGIPNCDTVKKARKWLETKSIDYHFHDFRKDGVDKKQLSHWLAELGWEALVNRRSTTWRGLAEQQKAISSNQDALKLLLDNPSLIKRPVIESGNTLLVGFKETDWQQLSG